MAERPTIPRTVKPRKPYRAKLSIIACAPDGIFSEFTGEVTSATNFDVFAKHPSALLACLNPEWLLEQLHVLHRDDPQWQFRLTPIQREYLHSDGKRTTREELLINFFGFRRNGGGSSSRYFHPLAPLQFCRTSVHDLIPDDGPTWSKLYVWARQVRSFCRRYDLRPSPTGGGIAAQLLRHPRFYSQPRRKVPQKTNEKAREHLPGNWYEMRAKRQCVYAAAYYIDQAEAHHFCARTIPLPQSDRLRARGRFQQCEGRWIMARKPGWDALLAEHGLILLHAAIPQHLSRKIPQHLSRNNYMPPYVKKPGHHTIAVYTNELRELFALGVTPLWAVAAWTSPDADDGIRRHALWAPREVIAHPESAGWLKPTLLASYGILAAKPRHLETMFYRAKAGEKRYALLGAERIPVFARKSKRETQSPIANVIQRGMIEAETRRRSLKLARELSAQEYDVFAVYADAVIVRDDGRQLPLLPEPFRVKDRLTWLRFLNETSFESQNLSRLPGVPRSARVSRTDIHAPN